MVRYEDLMDIERFILDVRNDNSILFIIFVIVSAVVVIATLYLEYKSNRKKEQEEILEYRKAKRAWIKRNGGL